MKTRLLWKLIGANILTVGLVLVIVWIAVDYYASDYFVKLMEGYNIEPVDAHQMFVSCIRRYLILGGLFSLFFAVAASYITTRKVLRPLHHMHEVTQRYATGDFTRKVPVTTQDEVGQLAMSFNRMAENLEQLEQLRKTMVVNVAHELRTPLTNIQGYLEGIQDEVVKPDKKTIDLLLMETRRLGRFVEDILELTRADATRVSLEKTTISVEDLIEKMMHSFHSKLEEKNIRTSVSFDERSMDVFADPYAISQVVRNLLQNAVQYTPPGGMLKIRTQPLDHHVKVTLTNTGREVNREDVPYLFERFYRGEKSRSREHGGAGIGLALVKEFIEAHNGEAGVEFMDGDISFWFTLPIHTS